MNVLNRAERDLSENLISEGVFSVDFDLTYRNAADWGGAG
jgi:hypothetical protein